MKRPKGRFMNLVQLHVCDSRQYTCFDRHRGRVKLWERCRITPARQVDAINVISMSDDTLREITKATETDLRFEDLPGEQALRSVRDKWLKSTTNILIAKGMLEVAKGKAPQAWDLLLDHDL